MNNFTLNKGFYFGFTSGIITTLGLMVGLQAGTHLKLAVIGGILTIAIADAFSDSLGIHIAEEATKKNKSKEVWKATITTFIAKFVLALTFVVPVLLFDLASAVIVSMIWGLVLIGALSYFIAKKQGSKPFNVIAEHLLITLIVVILTHYAGEWIGSIFS